MASIASCSGEAKGRVCWICLAKLLDTVETLPDLGPGGPPPPRRPTAPPSTGSQAGMPRGVASSQITYGRHAALAVRYSCQGTVDVTVPGSDAPKAASESNGRLASRLCPVSFRVSLRGQKPQAVASRRKLLKTCRPRSCQNLKAFATNGKNQQKDEGEFRDSLPPSHEMPCPSNDLQRRVSLLSNSRGATSSCRSRRFRVTA